MAGKPITYDYSIFLILADKVSTLKRQLKKKGLEQTARKQIAHNNFTFYFSSSPTDTPVHWMDPYKDFLPDIKQQYNIVYYGVLLVETKEGATFAVSLGKAHFYIEPFCDAEFGMDLAERIIDPNELRKKGSKHLFDTKNQSLISYRESSSLDNYESGEFYRYLVAATTSEDHWGKKVDFGANIHLKIPLKPSELSSLLNRIQKTLRKIPQVPIPRARQVTKTSLINKLEKKLMASLNNLDGRYSSPINLSWNDLSFTDNYESSIYITGKKKEKLPLETFDIQSLKNVAKQGGIALGDQLDQLKIELIDQDSTRHNQPLRLLIDYVDKEGNCLLNGQWKQFNESYIDHLIKSIDKIDLDYDPKQNLSNQKLAAYLSKNSDGYAEKYFNSMREKEGFVNKDRDIVLVDGRFRVETMDLYKKSCLYFVKLGTPQKLSYVVDQAKNTLQLIKNHRYKVKIKNSNISPKRACIWLVLDRQKPISQLSEIDSLIFHFKMNEWISLCRSMNIIPHVKINYRVN